MARVKTHAESEKIIAFTTLKLRMHYLQFILFFDTQVDMKVSKPALKRAVLKSLAARCFVIPET